MLGFRHSDALDTERSKALNWVLKIVLCNSCSFSAFHFDFTGDIGVGKSSLVRRFFLGEFNEAYHGGSQSKKREKASLPCVDNYERHGLIIWDGDRQPVKYPPRGLGLWWDHELPITAAVVVVYDITKPSSFNEAKRHVEKYCSDWRLLESFPVVGLVGSKADLWKRRKIKYEVLSCYNYIHVNMELITLLSL